MISEQLEQMSRHFASTSDHSYWPNLHGRKTLWKMVYCYKLTYNAIQAIHWPGEAAFPPAHPPATQTTASSLSSPIAACTFPATCRYTQTPKHSPQNTPHPWHTSSPCLVQLSVSDTTTLASASSLANRSTDSTHCREGGGKKRMWLGMQSEGRAIQLFETLPSS